MKDVDDPAALAESTLRQALRLEADERPSRFDAAAIVAAAERRTLPQQLLRALRGIALVGVSLGIESVVAIAAFNALASIDLSAPFGFVLTAVAAGAEQVVALGVLIANPSVAVAALATVIFATLYERSTGRESISVRRCPKRSRTNRVTAGKAAVWPNTATRRDLRPRRQGDPRVLGSACSSISLPPHAQPG